MLRFLLAAGEAHFATMYANLCSLIAEKLPPLDSSDVSWLQPGLSTARSHLGARLACVLRSRRRRGGPVSPSSWSTSARLNSRPAAARWWRRKGPTPRSSSSPASSSGRACSVSAHSRLLHCCCAVCVHTLVSELAHLPLPCVCRQHPLHWRAVPAQADRRACHSAPLCACFVLLDLISVVC